MDVDNSQESKANPISPHWKKLKMQLVSQCQRNQQKKKPSQDRRKRKLKKKLGVIAEKSKMDCASASDNGTQLTKVLAIDCEYVGGGDGGEIDLLARVSIVSSQCECVYDEYVLPKEPVTDYRTHVSGIRPANLVKAKPFDEVRKTVLNMFRKRIIVGHSVHNDFRVLQISHPKKYVRDTAQRLRLNNMQNFGTPSLKELAKRVLGITIQQGEHDSIIDAKTAMQIYNVYRAKWEASVARYRKKN